MTTRCQQDEIYAAENGVNHGMWFTKEADAQAWLDALRDRWWWSKFFWKAPARTEVYWRARGSSSVGSYHKDEDAGLLEMLPPHRNELIMLHELSHVIADALNDSHAHDPFFARTYATLVYLVLGSDTWLQLQHAFDEHGVDYMQGSVTT
jgi:putative metallohydrolase (TIGR04338 family)